MSFTPYKTISNDIVCEIDKIKGSRFIAVLRGIKNRDEAELVLKEVKKSYQDASHHCFAYQINDGGNIFQRFSDDNEPSGTAGRPILQVLDGNELKNVILIVIRYYGGVKLGTGGLAKAYTEAALEAISLAQIIQIEARETLSLKYDYSRHKAVLVQIKEFDPSNVEQIFTDKVELLVEIRCSDKELFISSLIEKNHGQIEIS